MNELESQLEQLIDKHGLTAVVDSICSICYGKQEHIAANYGDEKLAHSWGNAGASLVNRKAKFLETPFPS